MTSAVGASIRTAHAPLWVIFGISVTGIVFRLIPFLSPGVILGEREYDDGVMFSGALMLLHGQMPYRDFVYLHPPGSLVTLVPTAALSGITGEPSALAVARLLAIVVGGLNVLMIAFLLRSRGTTAVLVGAGGYAVWPVIISTERTILLEPILNLCLLIALACIASRRTWAMAGAGAIMGVALSVKYWAIVDVVVLAVVIGLVLGARALLTYLSSGLLVSLAIIGPFFIAAPTEMWQLTVETQLGRQATQSPPLDRTLVLSPILNLKELNQVAPSLLWGVLVVSLLLIALSPLTRAIAGRRTVRAWADPVWWGVIATVHAAILTVSAVYYYHYAAWLMAPLLLAVGSQVTLLPSIRARRVVAGAVIITIGILGVAEWRLITPTPVKSEVLVSWAADRECVWGLPSVLVAADAVRRNLAHGCPFDVDPYGVGLVIGHVDGLSSDTRPEDNPGWQTRAEEQLRHADGAAFTSDLENALPHAMQNEFASQFEFAKNAGSWTLWNRSAR